MADQIIGSFCVDCAVPVMHGDREVKEDGTLYRLCLLETELPDGDRYAEAYFSWSPCDWCGSDLGGDRYDIEYFPVLTSNNEEEK